MIKLVTSVRQVHMSYCGLVGGEILSLVLQCAWYISSILDAAFLQRVGQHYSFMLKRGGGRDQGTQIKMKVQIKYLCRRITKGRAPDIDKGLYTNSSRARILVAHVPVPS